MFTVSKIKHILMSTRAWSSLPEPEKPTSFGRISKPEPEKNSIIWDCKTRTRKKLEKLKLDQILPKILKNFGKKWWILVKFWLNFSVKPINLKTRRVFGQFSKTRKTQTRKVFKFWNPKNSNPNIREVAKPEAKEFWTRSSSNEY